MTDSKEDGSTWEEISKIADVREVISLLGNAGVTVRGDEIKGGYHDGEGWCKAYYSASDLRSIAYGCDVIARFLEENVARKSASEGRDET